MIREREYNGLPGIPVLIALLLVERAWCGRSSRPSEAETPVGIVARQRRPGVRHVPAVRAVHGAPEPGQGAAAVRPVPRHREGAGAALGEPASDEEGGVAARAQLRELAPQGQRQRRQPDRDRRGRGVEGRRNRRGRVRSGRLRELRARAERIGAAQSRDELSLRRARRAHWSRCAATPRQSPNT